MLLNQSYAELVAFNMAFDRVKGKRKKMAASRLGYRFGRGIDSETIHLL